MRTNEQLAKDLRKISIALDTALLTLEVIAKDNAKHNSDWDLVLKTLKASRELVSQVEGGNP